MSLYTVAWLLLGAGVAAVEGVALFNSTRGDTLSEHVWAWLGVQHFPFWRARNPELNDDTPVTPTWFMRISRLVVAAGLTWVTVHFVTGLV